MDRTRRVRAASPFRWTPIALERPESLPIAVPVRKWRPRPVIGRHSPSTEGTGFRVRSNRGAITSSGRSGTGSGGLAREATRLTTNAVGPTSVAVTWQPPSRDQSGRVLSSVPNQCRRPYRRRRRRKPAAFICRRSTRLSHRPPLQPGSTRPGGSRPRSARSRFRFVYGNSTILAAGLRGR